MRVIGYTTKNMNDTDRLRRFPRDEMRTWCMYAKHWGPERTGCRIFWYGLIGQMKVTEL